MLTQMFDIVDVIKKPLNVKEKWTEEEHAQFVKSVRIHGKNWKLVKEDVKTKTL